LEKKSFGKPCWDKSTRTVGVGSIDLFRDGEQAAINTPADKAMTPLVRNFIANHHLQDIFFSQVQINGKTGNFEILAATWTVCGPGTSHPSDGTFNQEPTKFQVPVSSLFSAIFTCRFVNSSRNFSRGSQSGKGTIPR
jgi:hypothetical protein